LYTGAGVGLLLGANVGNTVGVPEVGSKVGAGAVGDAVGFDWFGEAVGLKVDIVGEKLGL
jgi:hypothetical protein